MVSKKGGVQSVSLLDTSTLEATYSRDAGSLVPQAEQAAQPARGDQAPHRRVGRRGATIGTEQKAELRAAWDAFEEDYIKALDDFISVGLHGEAVMRQAESFAALLRTLAVHARGDVCRSRLVSEVLSIGTVRVAGDQPALIIPPWHPERMKALAVKTRRVAGLVAHMLAGRNVLFGDRGIFFREFSEELAHPFYPEIAVALARRRRRSWSAESSTVNGYSLLRTARRGRPTTSSPTSIHAQPPNRQESSWSATSGLQPHEAANLSVLLYNADAAELPLGRRPRTLWHADRTDFQCNVSVRHRDPAKLRRVYAELVTKSGDDPDLPVVSETSENFISKLRISVVPPSATPPRSGEGFRPFDVAFLHDVVSRTAVGRMDPRRLD